MTPHDYVEKYESGRSSGHCKVPYCGRSSADAIHGGGSLVIQYDGSNYAVSHVPTIVLGRLETLIQGELAERRRVAMLIDEQMIRKMVIVE